MTTKRSLAILAVTAGLVLGGCAENSMFDRPGDTKFGDANRQTMMAQVINPDPVYDTDMVASGEVAAAAVERYRTDSVKQPDSIRTTDVGPGGGGNSSGGGSPPQ